MIVMGVTLRLLILVLTSTVETVSCQLQKVVMTITKRMAMVAIRAALLKRAGNVLGLQVFVQRYVVII